MCAAEQSTIREGVTDSNGESGYESQSEVIPLRLQQKVALITGAASGIGEASAKRFAGEGAFVIVADQDQSGGARVVSQIQSAGGQAAFVKMDVTDAAGVEAAIAQALGVWGRVDVLFNNAGIGCVGTLHETPEDEWDRVMAVNVKGIYLVTRQVVPHMIERGSGTIINMSSCIAQIGLAQRVAYAASKGAVLAMTRSMQVDYAPHGIRVNALLPGTIFTPFVENYLRKSYADPEAALERIRGRQLTGELGTPDDVAHAAVFLASDESKYVVGSGLIVDGGVTAGK